MRLIRAAVVSINTKIGAVDANTEAAIHRVRALGSSSVALAVFQEQLFGGYPAEDLVHSSEFVASQWQALKKFAEATTNFDIACVVGLAVRVGGFTYNASAMVYRGRVLGITPKEHLPTYGVFYEKRVFAEGGPGMYRENDGIPFGDLIYEFPFGTVATPICEDVWVPDGPILRRSIADIQAIANSSPARLGVVETRREMLSTRSADNECVLLAAYQVGGNDALVFDGGGYCFQNGQLIGEMEHFREGYMMFDIDLSRTDRMRNQNTTWRMRQEHLAGRQESFRRIRVEEGPKANIIPVERAFARRFSFLPTDQAARDRAFDYIVDTAVNGLAGYFEKSGAKFENVSVALSGGKDSALTAILAWLYAKKRFTHWNEHERGKAIKKFIRCYSMPTRHNSDMTRSIAHDLCAELGLSFSEDSIEEAYELELAALRRIAGQELDDTTRGNVQARIRGSRKWNLSNVLKSLWLQTGNMSEKSVGYTTIGGDLMGAYSLIGNIPKTVIELLLVYLGQKYKLESVVRLMKTRASAELADGQFDEDELMPFPVLDLCFLLYCGEWYAPDDMYRVLNARWTDDELKAMDPRYKTGTLKTWIGRFLRLFHASIFKWVQSPETVHIGSLDLDRERALQLPVIHGSNFLEASLQRMHELP